MKSILIVGAGHNQVAMIRKAREMGLRAIAADGAADAPGFAVADVAEVVDITNGPALTETARRHNVSAVYPGAEAGVIAAAHVAEALGLPGVSPSVATRVRDKHAMRVAMAKAGLPAPRFFGVKSLTDAQDAARQLGLPFIVKPADGNASRGVILLDHIEELPLAFARAMKISRNQTVLLEEFLPGMEYHVDGLVHQGEYFLGGMTGKQLSPLPHRFDQGIYLPPDLTEETAAAIVETVRAALRAIGFHTGSTHIEVMLTPEGPRIVEIAGRPGGARIPSDLIPLSYGKDYLADSLRVALGEPPRESGAARSGSALFWIPTRSGVVTEIRGVDEARAIKGVREVVIVAKLGDVIGHLVDCVTRDKVGYVLTVGPDAATAVARAKEALGRIKIVTQPMQ